MYGYLMKLRHSELTIDHSCACVNKYIEVCSYKGKKEREDVNQCACQSYKYIVGDIHCIYESMQTISVLCLIFKTETDFRYIDEQVSKKGSKIKSMYFHTIRCYIHMHNLSDECN